MHQNLPNVQFLEPGDHVIATLTSHKALERERHGIVVQVPAEKERLAPDTIDVAFLHPDAMGVERWRVRPLYTFLPMTVDVSSGQLVLPRDSRLDVVLYESGLASTDARLPLSDPPEVVLARSRHLADITGQWGHSVPCLGRELAKWCKTGNAAKGMAWVGDIPCETLVAARAQAALRCKGSGKVVLRLRGTQRYLQADPHGTVSLLPGELKATEWHVSEGPGGRSFRSGSSVLCTVTPSAYPPLLLVGLLVLLLALLVFWPPRSLQGLLLRIGVKLYTATYLTLWLLEAGITFLVTHRYPLVALPDRWSGQAKLFSSMADGRIVVPSQAGWQWVAETDGTGVSLMWTTRSKTGDAFDVLPRR